MSSLNKSLSGGYKIEAQKAIERLFTVVLFFSRGNVNKDLVSYLWKPCLEL
jgi:hypothetical protein